MSYSFPGPRLYLLHTTLEFSLSNPVPLRLLWSFGDPKEFVPEQQDFYPNSCLLWFVNNSMLIEIMNDDETLIIEVKYIFLWLRISLFCLTVSSILVIHPLGSYIVLTILSSSKLFSPILNPPFSISFNIKHFKTRLGIPDSHAWTHFQVPT